MGSQKQKGFTIIEVMLFLAISALLLAALFVGINTSINQQRYKDSVTSLVGNIQEQYVLAANVNNQRDPRWTCDVAAPSINPVADNSRGTTKCIIVGRLVQIKDGTAVTASNIVAYRINNELLKVATSDIQALTEAATLVSLTDTDSTTASEVFSDEIAWGSQVKMLNRDGSLAGTSKNATIAIIRSPVTGTISTFVVNELTTDWKRKILTPESRDRALIACIVSVAPLAGPQQAVYIAPGNSNTSGVSQKPEAAGC